LPRKSAASERVNGPEETVWAGPLAESFDGLKRWDVTVLGFPGLRGQRQPEVAMDKSKGRMREAAGAFTATRPRRPRAGPSKADAVEEAKQREKTRQAEAERAEKERDRQRRKEKGPPGGLGDTLSGR
jgi:hypothetical protein